MYTLQKGDSNKLLEIGEILNTMKGKFIFLHARDSVTQNVIRIQGIVKWIKIGNGYVMVEFEDNSSVFIEEDKVGFVSYRISTDVKYDILWFFEQ